MKGSNQLLEPLGAQKDQMWERSRSGSSQIITDRKCSQRLGVGDGDGDGLGVLQRWLGRLQAGWRTLLGQGRLADGSSRQRERGPADRGPDEAQHAGGEQDEDPGVDDGVDRDEAEGDQVQAVGLALPDAVDVNSDLREKEGGRGRGGRSRS